MDIEYIWSSLAGSSFHQVRHFTTIDSTNTRAVEEARNNAPSGIVYIADEQTAGRGRGGHAWHSRPGDGLYLSAQLRPNLPTEHTFKLSLAAGLAAQHAVREVAQVSIDLRWPNDLILNRLKLGGILSETSASADGQIGFAVIGIGINLNHAQMPDELAHLSTSLRIATGHEARREDIAISLLQALSHEIAALEKDPESILPRFARASSWVFGKKVTVAEDDGYTGITDGLSATGLLRVLCEDGSIREVRHGGVREA